MSIALKKFAKKHYTFDHTVYPNHIFKSYRYEPKPASGNVLKGPPVSVTAVSGTLRDFTVIIFNRMLIDVMCSRVLISDYIHGVIIPTLMRLIERLNIGLFVE